MTDRINSVYGQDSQFPHRASQDNEQVRTMYDSWLGRPLGEKSEELLHTKWYDRSAHIKDLIAQKVYPNPVQKTFSKIPYGYER